MSTKLEPYLNFNDGQCEMALNFYKQAFGNATLEIMRFSDAPMPYEEKDKNLVMHAMFQSGDVIFLASDCMGEQPAQIGNNISMTLNFTDETEQTRLFNALAEGGKITMPLDDAFWGARFGMVIDQFGIQWLFNLPKTA